MSLDTPAKRLTPWFPLGTRPARRGVYERDTPTVGRYAFWDGIQWYGYAQSPRHAKDSYNNRFVSVFQQEGQWRGLARKP
jgi:hypothetical protein